MKYRVQNPQGVEIAQCVHAEDAAALVALYGDGATIRARMGTRDYVRLWTEGEEEIPAGESYDQVRETCTARALAAFKARGLKGPPEIREAPLVQEPTEYRGYLIVELAGGGYSVQRRSSATREPFHVAYAATADRARKLIEAL